MNSAFGIWGQEEPDKFQDDLTKAQAVWDVFGPKVIGLFGDLTEKRKNSLAGLYRQKAKLEKKISKARTQYIKDSFISQLAHIDTQIALLEGAIATNAPEGDVDDLESPKGSPVPWILGGILLVGTVGVVAYVLTREQGKKNA